MGHRRKVEDESSSGDSSSLSSDTRSSSPDVTRRRKRRREKRESDSTTKHSSSDDDDETRRKEKKRQRRKRRQRREHHSSEKKKKKTRRSLKKSRRQQHRHDESDDDEEEHGSSRGSQARLQVKMEAREQEKVLVYQNAKLAKDRLNGELREVQAQQAKLQDLYGTVDWRARKKLRLEKKKLERSVAAGKKLAQIEEEECARMDAFRVALGLPTAEAQRQAEWRAEATRALQEPPPSTPSKPPKKAIIGPQLPR